MENTVDTRNLVLRSGMYYYQRRAFGLRLSLSTGTPRLPDARRYRDRLEAQAGIAPGQSVVREPANSVFEVGERLIEQEREFVSADQMKRSTLDERIRMLKAGGALMTEFGHRCVSSVQQEEIIRWARDRVTRGELSVRSVHNQLSALSRLFQQAQDEALISASPVTGLRRRLRLKDKRRGPRPIRDPSKLAALVSFYVDRSEGLTGKPREVDWPRHMVLILLMLDAGLRPGEAIALAWEDVDLEAGTLTIRRNAPRSGSYVENSTKSGEPREIRMSRRLHAQLVNRREIETRSRAAPDEFIARMSQSQLGRIFRRAKTAAGIADPDVTPHSLRHTYASIALTSGQSVAKIAAHLGHKPSVTEEVYARWLPGSDKDDPLPDFIERWTATAE